MKRLFVALSLLTLSSAAQAGYVIVSGGSSSSGSGGVVVPSSFTWPTIAVGSITVTSGIPFRINYKAALCQAGTASLGFSTYTSSGPTATCASSGLETFGEAYFVDSSTNAVQDHFSLPSDWVGAIDVGIVWRSTVTANNVVWKVRTACVADAEVPGNAAYNFPNTVTDAAKGTTLQLNTASISAITTTGCSAGEELYFEFLRDPANTSDTLIGTAQLVGVTFTLRRSL